MVKLIWVGANNVYPEKFEHLNSNKNRVTYISAVKFYIGCKPMICQVAKVFTNQPFLCWIFDMSLDYTKFNAGLANPHKAFGCSTG